MPRRPTCFEFGFSLPAQCRLAPELQAVNVSGTCVCSASSDARQMDTRLLQTQRRVNNPWTLVPIYAAAIYIGGLFLGWKAEEQIAYIDGSSIYRHKGPGIIHEQAEQECNAVQAEEKRNCQAKEGVQSV